MNLTSFVAQLGAVGLDLAVKGTVWLLWAWLVVAACRRASAATRHALWLAALLGLLLLPLTTWLLPDWRLPVLPSSASSRDVVASGDELPQSPPPDPREAPPTTPEVVTPVESAAPAPPVASRPHSAMTATATRKPAPPLAEPSMATATPSWWTPLLVAGWLAGGILSASAVARGLRATSRLRRDSRGVDDRELLESCDALRRQLALRRSVELREHPAPVVPLTWGVLWPVVLLPAPARRWSEGLRRTVLLHELAHVRRHDVVTQLVARLACALHWFQPLAWYALRRLREEREQACDDLVVRAGERPSDYAERLVEVARLCGAGGAPALAVAMAEGNTLERRVRSLFDSTRGHGPLPRATALAVLVLGALALGTVSSFRPVAIEVGRADDPAAPDKPRDPEAPPAAVPADLNVLTGEEALERVLELNPQFGEPRHGVQLGVAYSTSQLVYYPGNRVPVELFVRNSGEEECLLRLMPSVLPTVRDSNREALPVSRPLYEAPTFTIRLRPGAVCVLKTQGLGVGAEADAPALGQLTIGFHQLYHDVRILALGGERQELWQEVLTTSPLSLQVAEEERAPGGLVVKTVGVMTTGILSPERLALLNPRFGEPRRGIQLGVAVNTLRRSFDERMPLLLLYKNVGAVPLTFDTHLDFIAYPPDVIDERGERLPVSYILHWRFIGPTTITLAPGEVWVTPTPALGLQGQTVSALKSPPPGRYRLTYSKGIFEKLGRPATEKIWSERLTTGELEFEIVTVEGRTEARLAPLKPGAQQQASNRPAAGGLADAAGAEGAPPAADAPSKEEEPVDSTPAAPKLDDHVLWWETWEGLQVGFWPLTTGEPLNLRVPEDSLVTYQVVVRNTTDQPLEIGVRASSTAGKETPALVSSGDDFLGALEQSPLPAEFLARPAQPKPDRMPSQYLIRLGPGESVLVPGILGPDHGHLSLQVGGERRTDQPQVTEYKAGMNWLVQPVTIYRMTPENRTGLIDELGNHTITRCLADGTMKIEFANRVGGLRGGRTLYPRIQLEVGTLNASASRHAHLATWGEVDRGIQCGVRILNPRRAYQQGDTIEAEVLWRNTSDQVVATSLPRQLDLYPSIEDDEGNLQLIDFGARFNFLPGDYEFQPGEVRSLGVSRIKLVAEGTPSPKSNMEPGQITLAPGKYHLIGNGGVGTINPNSGKLAFEVE